LGEGAVASIGLLPAPQQSSKLPNLFIFLPIWVVAVTILLIGAMRATAGGLYWYSVPLLYGNLAIKGFILIVFCLIFVQVLEMAKAGEENPAARLKEFFLSRDTLSRALLPVVASPIFLGGFSTNKFLISFDVLYDDHFRMADVLIFGRDVWLISYSWYPEIATEVLENFYNLWSLTMVSVLTMVALFASPRGVLHFYIGMFLTWIIGGTLIANAWPSVGPVYYDHFGFGSDFVPLMENVRHYLGSSSGLFERIDYLKFTKGGTYVPAGGGISAFPSMHVGVVLVFVVASRRFLFLSIPYAFAIWIGSIHLGWHYAVDGLASVPVVLLSWWLAGMFSKYWDRVGLRQPRPVWLRAASAWQTPQGQASQT
jgi:hypothetical protein